VAFATNYWHITASHVQRTAQPKAMSRSTVPAENQPVPQSQIPFDGQPRLNQAWAMPTRPVQPQIKPAESLNEQVVRMMQMSPNLTLEQVKAILKVGSFE